MSTEGIRSQSPWLRKRSTVISESRGLGFEIDSEDGNEATGAEESFMYGDVVKYSGRDLLEHLRQPLHR